MDTSRNVGQQNTRHQVEFVISLASSLYYGNITVISYAAEAQFVVTEGQLSNFSDFVQTLRNASYTTSYSKNLGNALMKAESLNTSKYTVLIAMIAGRSNDELDIPAFQLKRKGVTIYALALSSGYSMSEVTFLVSKPVGDHVLKAEFTDLKHFINITRNTICKGKTLKKIPR